MAGESSRRLGVVMSKPNTHRVILRVARFGMAGGGICLLLSLPAQQADAATVSQPSLLSGLTSGVSSGIQAVTDPVTNVLGSVVSSVAKPVSSAAPAAVQAAVPTSQAASAASASRASQSTAPSQDQTSPEGQSSAARPSS